MSTSKLEVGNVVFSKDPSRSNSMRNFVVLEVGERLVKIEPLKDKSVGPYWVSKGAVTFMYKAVAEEKVGGPKLERLKALVVN